MSTRETMKTKTVLITGATDGIGKVTALEIARTGARVVLVGRNEEKGTEVVEELRRRTSNDAIELMCADLSRMSEVVRLARAFLEAHDRLDVLVNNVGAIFMERRETAEGFERTWALNHLGYVLLTQRLLDKLKATAQAHGQARVVNVSSRAHKSSKGIDFDDLNREKSYAGWSRYCESKLANILFTRELAARLEGTKVSANALHPGFVASKFGHLDNGWKGSLVKLSQVFAISVEKGADTSVFLATSPDVSGVSGEYFYQRRVSQPSRRGVDAEAARRLWEATEATLAGVQ